MKILIIENEYTQVENAFNYLNAFYFDNQLDYSNISKSQELNPLSEIKNYDIVFLDISLAPKSEMDGYAILKKIESDKIPVKRIIILTGNHNIEEGLSNRGIEKKYEILTKPIDFHDLKRILSH